jgi:HK97 family phage major capsid protein
MTIKALRQQKADLVAEAKTLMSAATAEDRRLTDAERKRDDEISAALDTINDDLARAERQAERERDIMLQNSATSSAPAMGADHAAERPWGPTVPSNASPATQAEARTAALGEFAAAVYRASMGHSFDPRLAGAASGMGTAVPSEGGFAVPMEVAAGIERDMFAGGQLLSRVDVRTISGDSIAYNVIDETSRATGSRQGGVVGYWVDQGTAPTSSMPKLARVEMKLRKVGALGYMTDELVSDAVALGGELQAMFNDELIFQVEDAITEGTGAGQPLGYLNAPCIVSQAKETGQAAATILAANLSKMWARMPARDKALAVWLINGDCGPMLDQLSIPAGTSALEPRFVNYGPDGLLTIKGRPVIETEYNATLGTVGDIVLINLKKYRLIRKGGVEQTSSIHVRFAQGEQTFRAFYRCDGQMVPRSPLTPFKGTANTLSPVVTLAVRA